MLVQCYDNTDKIQYNKHQRIQHEYNQKHITCGEKSSFQQYLKFPFKLNLVLLLLLVHSTTNSIKLVRCNSFSNDSLSSTKEAMQHDQVVTFATESSENSLFNNKKRGTNESIRHISQYYNKSDFGPQSFNFTKAALEGNIHIYLDNTTQDSIDSSIQYIKKNDNVINFFNRESVLNRYSSYVKDIFNDFLPVKSPDKQESSSSLTYKYSTANINENIHDNSSTMFLQIKNNKNRVKYQCQSCEMREKAKLDNLESIKMHILMRLQMSRLPNITSPIAVPHNILEKFYKVYNLTTKSRNINNKNNRDALVDTANITPQLFKNNVDIHRNENIADKIKKDFLDEDDPKNEMQKDEPISFQNFASKSKIKPKIYSDEITRQHYNTVFDNSNEFEEEGIDLSEEDHYQNDIFPRVSSVYVFPTIQHMRHNRKSEILIFKFQNNYSKIENTILHIYVRGRVWISEYDASLLEEKHADGSTTIREELLIVIFKAVRRSNALDFTHTIKLTEFRQKIPSGLGNWIQIEIKELSKLWTVEDGNLTQGLLIRGLEPWMRPFVVTHGNDQNEPLTVHVEVLTKDKVRRKRSTSLDCQESDQEVRCCRYPLRVNFTNFGWHFVVAPTSFDAYFCNGECKLGYLEQYTHTHLTSLTTSAAPCCSPTKMSSLSLLYFNLDQNLVLSTIPNMSVEKCSCS